jgi:endonuclease-3
VTTPQEHFEKQWPRLVELYPDARCGLDYQNAYQLLIATILAAQCTDERINALSPALFKRYPDPAALAEANQDEVERYIYSAGFYKNKAKNIIAACQQIVEKHNGEVPQSMAELVVLPGVARKTASVVLGNVFNKNEGIAVDTHVTRLSQRLGWTKETAQEKIERDLMQLVPRDDWTMVNHRLVWHGRLVCAARKPNCPGCGLNDVCPSSLLLSGVGVQTAETELE